MTGDLGAIETAADPGRGLPAIERTANLVGVYHARRGGALNFDGAPVVAAPNPAVRRGLAGVYRTNAKPVHGICASPLGRVGCALVAVGRQCRPPSR
jgi:hypothetical protein